MKADRSRNGDQRKQDRLGREDGRRLFDEGLREFGRRHAASLGAAVLVIALLAEFADLWLGAVLDPVATKRGNPARSELQVVGDRSASGISFTNRDSSALSAQNHGLSPARLATALRLAREHQDEIRAAWNTHFRR